MGTLRPARCDSRGGRAGALLPGVVERDVRQGARGAADARRRRSIRAARTACAKVFGYWITVQLPRGVRHVRGATASSSTTSRRAAARRSSRARSRARSARFVRGEQDASSSATSTRSATGATRGTTWRRCGGCSSGRAGRLRASQPARRTRCEEFLERGVRPCAGSSWRDYVKIDERYFRPSEVDLLIGDYSKAKAEARLGADRALPGARADDGRRRPRARPARRALSVMWPRDDAKLERVRALMASDGLDALVVRAPDNVLYLTNFWGMKGYDACVVPARGRAGAHLPRGLGGGRGAHGVDDGRRASCAATTESDPRPRAGADARRGARASRDYGTRRPRAVARHAGVRPHGRRADDVHEGVVRRVGPTPRTRRRCLARPARSRPSRRSSACGSRTRSRAQAMEHVRGELRPGMKESEAARDLAGLRARRGHRLRGRRSSSRSASRSSGPGTGIKTFTATGDLPVRRGRADAVRDLGLRRRLLVPTTRRTLVPRASCAPDYRGARGRAARRLRARDRALLGRARASPSSTGRSGEGIARARLSRASRRIRSATASARARTSRRTPHQAAAAIIEEAWCSRSSPACYWEGGGGLRVEDNFLDHAPAGSRSSRRFPDGVVTLTDLIWTGSLNDAYAHRRARRPLRHDAARRRADGRRRARPGAEARDRAAARRARRRPDRGRLPARLRRRLARGRADRRGRAARARSGASRAPCRPTSRRSSSSACRLLGDRVADLRPEARRDRRRRARRCSSRITSAMRFAAEHGIHAAFFGVDSTRAEPDFYERVYETAVEAGATEVVVVDTLGIASPEAVADLVGHDQSTGRRRAGALPRPQRLRPRDGSRGRGGARGRDVGPRDDQRHGRAGRQREPRRGRADAARALRRRVEPAPRPDPRRLRARAGAVGLRRSSRGSRSTGETLFRRESGAVASQFHDPPSIEPYSSELVAAERGDRARQEERRSTRSASRPRSSASTCPRSGAPRCSPRVKQLGAEKRGLVTDDEFRELVAWLDYDAVIVGSGVNSPRLRARCSRAAAGGVCVLERERLARRRDPHGGDHRAAASRTTSSARGTRSGSAAPRTRSSATSSPRAGSST